MYQLMKADIIPKMEQVKLPRSWKTALPELGFIPMALQNCEFDRRERKPIARFMKTHIMTKLQTIRCRVKKAWVWRRYATIPMLITATATRKPNFAESDPRSLGMTLRRSSKACREFLGGKCSGSFGVRSESPSRMSSMLFVLRKQSSQQLRIEYSSPLSL